MILLKESDKPKDFGEKVAEYMAAPPLPILRVQGDYRTEQGAKGDKHVLFAVRNGLPIPLLYGIYVEVAYKKSASESPDLTEYKEEVDHIGPWSTDNWRLTISEMVGRRAQVNIRVGLVPFEVTTDKVVLVI